MPFLNINIETETTPLQKLLVILFGITIFLSCLSLVWIQIEKPEKVSYSCSALQGLMNPANGTVSLKELDSGLSNIPKLEPTCKKTVNPPMSAGLVGVINLATVSGVLFVVVSGYAYVFRKKEPEKKVEPEDQPDRPS